MYSPVWAPRPCRLYQLNWSPALSLSFLNIHSSQRVLASDKSRGNGFVKLQRLSAYQVECFFNKLPRINAAVEQIEYLLYEALLEDA